MCVEPLCVLGKKGGGGGGWGQTGSHRSSELVLVEKKAYSIKPWTGMTRIKTNIEQVCL